MGYEKILIFIFCSMLLISCASTGAGTGIPDPVESGTEIRNNIAELQNGQAEIAESAAEVESTNQQLAATVDRAAEISDELETIIRTGTQTDIEFAEIIRDIYNQPAEGSSHPP